jgi:hypothetical protein
MCFLGVCRVHPCRCHDLYLIIRLSRRPLCRASAQSLGGRIVSLFTQNKRNRVQSVILKLVNTHCSRQQAFPDGPRLDRRVNLTLVTAVIPLEKTWLCFDRAFTAVTKEFSNSGVAIVVNESMDFVEAILGFRLEGQMLFLRAIARHQNSMGGGFHQMGFRLTEVVESGQYPELQQVDL